MFENLVDWFPYLGLATLGGMCLMPLARKVGQRQQGVREKEKSHNRAMSAVLVLTYRTQDRRDD